MSFDWNKHKSNSDFVTFKNIGDAVEGVITVVRIGEDFNSNPCPELLIKTKDGKKTLTAGQVMLKAALAEEAPQEGDTIRVVYAEDGVAKPGRQAPKLFNVTVTRGTPKATAAAVEDDEAPF